jgi:signal transduction histidine kinase/CheY-like chemotaxis protein
MPTLAQRPEDQIPDNMLLLPEMPLDSSSSGPTLPLEAVVVTAELERRPARSADFQAESQALADLMNGLMESDGNVLQELAETALWLCQAHSARISIAEMEQGREVFRWHAAAGQWAPFLQGTVPRESSPCGTVLSRNTPLLMAYPERHFPCSTTDSPPLAEVLLVPFRVEGITVGTVWVIAHDDSRHFDREDLRLLSSLSAFASVAYQAMQQGKEARAALAKEHAGSRLLQAISAGLIREPDANALYKQILDAATTIMRADFACIQTVDDGALHMVECAGCDMESARFFHRVGPDQATSCAKALRTAERCIIVDTELSAQLAGTVDLEEFRRLGIRAMQSTPLTSRSGELVGVLTTHWLAPHEPTADELRLFDVLARLAADLMERARTDQALREADRRKDEFLAVLSHELRNPLAPLKTGLELLLRAGDKPELVANIHSMMSRQLAHLVRLVDDLLDLSRITRNRIELQRARLELRVVLDAAIELSRPLIEQRQHRLSIEHADCPLPVYADRERLTQAVSNVLGNAAKYTAAGGTIRMYSGGGNGEATVRIRDSGFGIPAEQLESVFDMFNQVPEHRRRGGSGLGIGLALSRRLLELHGGSIAAQSEGLDRGSEFIIRLPLMGPEEARVSNRGFGIHGANTRRRILIVDDNIDAAEMLYVGLEGMGHTVQAANSALAGLRLIDTFDPDAVLLDIGLPEINGYDLARRIRALPGRDKLLLIAITGWGQKRDREQALEAGFDHHLTKPVGLDAIEDLLKTSPPPEASA